VIYTVRLWGARQYCKLYTCRIRTLKGRVLGREKLLYTVQSTCSVRMHSRFYFINFTIRRLWSARQYCKLSICRIRTLKYRVLGLEKLLHTVQSACSVSMHSRFYFINFTIRRLWSARQYWKLSTCRTRTLNSEC
jgi:hypothetical protein